MDAVRLAPAPPPPGAHTYLPPEGPLAMPVQSLRDGARAAPVQFAARSIPARRAFVFGTALLLSAFGAYEMYLVLAVGGLTTLEAVILALFVILFAWIALSFASTLGGVLALLTGQIKPLDLDAGAPLPHIASRSALLLPTYNEAPDRVMSRVQAVHESVAETGALAAFDVFILSD